MKRPRRSNAEARGHQRRSVGRPSLAPVCLGDLVVAAFDEGALHSSDRREISYWAMKEIARVLLGTPATTSSPLGP
ncbi:MAG: hypothetical protein OEZ06_00550 [Myxococcales bacterium]|nr:hypothetical protein [Myxococcales bacterium]